VGAPASRRQVALQSGEKLASEMLALPANRCPPHQLKSHKGQRNGIQSFDAGSPDESTPEDRAVGLPSEKSGAKINRAEGRPMFYFSCGKDMGRGMFARGIGNFDGFYSPENYSPAFFGRALCVRRHCGLTNRCNQRGWRSWLAGKPRVALYRGSRMADLVVSTSSKNETFATK
jgi:hypothetical protein